MKKLIENIYKWLFGYKLLPKKINTVKISPEFLETLRNNGASMEENKSISETIIVKPFNTSQVFGKIIIVKNIEKPLLHSEIIKYSFKSDPVEVELWPTSGVIVFPKGTELNFDSDNDGELDAIRTRVSYEYEKKFTNKKRKINIIKRISTWLFGSYPNYFKKDNY